MKKGPIEVIQSKGIKIQIYSSPAFGKKSFVLSYYLAGQRKRERAKTLDAARAAAKARIVELSSGAALVANFTPKQTAVVTNAIETLQALGGVSLSTCVWEYSEATKILGGDGSIIQAALAYAKDAQRRRLPRKTVAEVASEYLDYVKSAGLSRHHLSNCKSRMGNAAAAFKTIISNVAAEDIARFLDKNRSWSACTFNNNRRTLVSLWRFAKRKGYLTRDQETAAELVAKRKDVDGEIKILTPEEFSWLLSNTPSPFLPLVAIGGLAGLRMAEISRLNWSEINFNENCILVSAQKSKTAQRRHAPICPALREWLLPLAKSEGSVMSYPNEGGTPTAYASDTSMLIAWWRVKKEIDAPHIPKNALRHSYASYRIAQTDDAAKVSLEMGNSPQLVFQHYRHVVTKTQAERWFSVMPASEEKVTAFAAV